MSVSSSPAKRRKKGLLETRDKSNRMVARALILRNPSRANPGIKNKIGRGLGIKANGRNAA